MQPEASYPDESTLVLTLDDANTRRTARIGEDIVVLLGENATTGFAWTAQSSNSTVLCLKSSRFGPTPESLGIVGAGGKRRFVFDALTAGEAALSFRLARAWNDETAESFVLTITVS